MNAMGARHPGEDAFEAYSLGTGTEEQTAEFEEHLLICEECRDRLDRVESYHRAMQKAARTIRTEERRSRVIPFPSRLVWAWAVGLALLGAALIYRAAPPGLVQVPAVQIALEATRGPVCTAPANRTLLLRPDLGGIAPFDRYRLEMVDARNATVWRGEISAADPRAAVPRHGPGMYFVRVYSPSRDLLREYGLELRN